MRLFSELAVSFPCSIALVVSFSNVTGCVFALAVSFFKKVSEYEQYFTTLTNCRPTHGTVRRTHGSLTVTRHPKDNDSKVDLLAVSFSYIFAFVVLFFNVTEFTVSFSYVFCVEKVNFKHY